MSFKMKMRTALAVVVCAGTAASAQSLATTDANNGSGGVFMDLTPFAPLEVTHFETYFSSTAGGASTVEVWIRPGTYVGFDASSAGWTLHETVNAVSAGTAALAPITLVNPIPLPDNMITAVYLQGVSGQTLRYTGTSTAPPQMLWSNGDLALFSDVARTGSTAFGGTRNSPRTFAGVVHYLPTGPVAAGACCFNDGSCQVILGLDCFNQGGIFHGGGTDCVSVNCPQPAACCFPNGTCAVLLETECDLQGGAFDPLSATCAAANCPQPAIGACCTSSGCLELNIFDCIDQSGVFRGDNTTCASGICSTVIFEAEPNNTKAEANPVMMDSGYTLVGTSTASTGTGDPNSPDYFVVKTAPAAPGIYRHRMTLNNATTPGGSAWVRAITQSATTAGTWPCSVGTGNAGTDSAGQSHIADGDDRINYWYGFGKEEQVYYRVSGLASTTGTYTATLDTEPVTPTELGNYQAGAIIISTADQGHTNDTSLRIYDANFEPVFGYANDRGSINGGYTANSTNVSYLAREYSAGTYYMAMTIGTLSAGEGAPCDDNIRSGVMADFPDAVFNVGTATTTDVSFSITDTTGPQAFVAHRDGTRQVAWYRFTVTGTIESGACCFNDGSCSELTELNCLAQGGAYQGNNTDCLTANCPQPGACCIPSGCTVVLPDTCLAFGGEYRGPNTECATANCPPPTVANIIGFNFATAAHNADPQNWNRISGPGTGSMSNAIDDSGAVTSVGIEWGSENFSFIGNSAVAGDAVPQHVYDLSGMNGYAFRSSAGAMFVVLSGLNPNTEYEYWVVAHRATLAMSNVVQVSEGDTINAISFNQIITSGENNGRFLVNAVNANNTMQWDLLAQRTTSSSTGTITVNMAATGSDATSLGALAIREILSGPQCYANCDGSTVEPVLNVDDFTCFINEFAAAQALPHEQQIGHYANCDGSTIAPVLNVDDFTCFINEYAAGCP